MVTAILVGLLAAASLSIPQTANSNSRIQQVRAFAPPMLDFSGLAWIEGNTFLAVHDSKVPEEDQRPRLSIISIDGTPDGPIQRVIEPTWPNDVGRSSDLESIAKIPDSSLFLLVESGESRVDGRQRKRVFLAEVRNGEVNIKDGADLPGTVRNIEGSAIAKINGRLVFIFAERADHQSSTPVFYSEMNLEPLRFNPPRQTRFAPVGFTGRNKRPVSAIEVSKAGEVYIASAYDPDDDNGPFSSVVWRAGKILASRDGVAIISFLRRPVVLGRLDGYKVESLALREAPGKAAELFAGTDDENYGGTIRPLAISF